MTAQSRQGGRRPAVSAAVLRDPVVPLDLGGWLRRVNGVARRGFGGLALLAAAPVLLSALYWIVLDVVRPSTADTRRQLAEAVAGSATRTLTPGIEFRVEVAPLLPTMVIFAVLIALATALCYGAGCHLALRQANGQPVAPGGAVRAAASRVLPFIGWGGLATVGTLAVFSALLVPGLVTRSPWLEVLCPGLGFVLMIVVATILLPTVVGVVFVERAGLGRSWRLVRPRFWFALGRTALMVVVYAVYTLLSGALVRLLLASLGGATSASLTVATIGHLAGAVLTLPLVVYSMAAALVSYAELRFREDPSTTTHTLAAALRR